MEVEPVRATKGSGAVGKDRYMLSKIRTATPFRSAPLFISPTDAEEYAAKFRPGQRVSCYQYIDDPEKVKLQGPDLPVLRNPNLLFSVLCFGISLFYWGPLAVKLWIDAETDEAKK